MKWRAWQPFLAADDVRYLHQVVVHNVGEMVSWKLVGTLVEHLVVEDTAVDANLATNDVVHDDVAARLNQEANHILLAFRDELLDLFFGESQRVAHLHSCACIVLEVLYLSTFRIEFFGRIKGDVGLPVVEKLLNILLIYIATLALAIRPMIAAEAHALVELDAEPLERLDDVFLCSRHEAARVGVFNAEDEVAAMLTGKEVVVERGTNTADMKRSGRAWSETDAHFFQFTIHNSQFIIE